MFRLTTIIIVIDFIKKINREYHGLFFIIRMSVKIGLISVAIVII